MYWITNADTLGYEGVLKQIPDRKSKLNKSTKFMYPKLTAERKLQAFADKFYQGVEWEPKKGDYYTTTRADLELYQVVDVDEECVYTTYLYEDSPISKWDKKGFTTEGFGDRRMYVPEYLLEWEVNT